MSRKAVCVIKGLPQAPYNLTSVRVIGESHPYLVPLLDLAVRAMNISRGCASQVSFLTTLPDFMRHLFF